ncbi:MAG TPA: two-component regulator propeller domain-containing protein, partial [Parafilimonas sp.]|nr:two-component regulator propeller domain-containing protein [Parafilimonas sp.]
MLSEFYPAQAQQVTCNRVSSPEGSYYGLILDLTQDREGYMWFALGGGGLRRYNGYHFITYLHDPANPASLAANTLRSVCADHNGIIWVGTEDSGLDRFDPEGGIFTHFRHDTHSPESLSDDRITTIIEDHSGTIWIGTKNGLNRLDEKTRTFTHYYFQRNDSTTLGNNFIQVLYEDHRNTLWVGNRSSNDDQQGKGGLNRFDQRTGKFKRYQHDPKNPHSLIDNRVCSIFEDSKGNFWVSTAGDGLHRMDREKGTFEVLRYDPSDASKLSAPPRIKGVDEDLHLFFICEDGTGVIWIFMSGGWITRYDPETKKVTHYNSINDDVQAMQSVSGGFKSHEGVLWITTWSGAIFTLDPFRNDIHHFATGSIVHAIHEDLSGTLWIGTFYEGIIRIDRGTGRIKRYLNKHDPGKIWDSWVTAFHEGKDDTLWIGHGNGLYLFDTKQERFKHYKNDPQNENSLSKGIVAAIIEDKPGSLWLATGGGLDLLDIKTGVFRHFRNNSTDGDSLSNNGFTSLLKDHSGKLWLGTGNGRLHRFDPRSGKFTHFACGTDIGNIVEDHENIIWVGTSTGLYRSNSTLDSFARFVDPGTGLTASTIIAGILEDDQRNLWVSSSAGIFRFNEMRTEIRVYNSNQGVHSSDLAYYLMRGEKCRHGELFFGDRTGYYAFFPGQFKNNTIPPQVVINEFRLADRLVKPGNGGPLVLPIARTK